MVVHYREGIKLLIGNAFDDLFELMFDGGGDVVLNGGYLITKVDANVAEILKLYFVDDGGEREVNKLALLLIGDGAYGGLMCLPVWRWNFDGQLRGMRSVGQMKSLDGGLCTMLANGGQASSMYPIWLTLKFATQR